MRTFAVTLLILSQIFSGTVAARVADRFRLVWPWRMLLLLAFVSVLCCSLGEAAPVSATVLDLNGPWLMKDYTLGELWQNNVVEAGASDD